MDYVRNAFRSMLQSRSLTVTAVLSLALGIGANTAIYALFYTIVVRPLSVPHPEQLVEFLQNFPNQPRSGEYWDWDSFEHFRAYNHVFSGIAGVSFDNLASVRTEHTDPETLIEENVTGNYFQVLELQPAIGRLLTTKDVPSRGLGEAAVVSWSYWNSRFHRDPGIIGRRIYVGDQPKTIVGVAPQSYRGPRVGAYTNIWLAQEHSSLTMLARLKPDKTLQQAQAESAVLYRFTREKGGRERDGSRALNATVQLESARAGLAHVRDQYGKPLLLLLGVVVLLLLLACLNTSSMLLARLAVRRREIAVQLALGASRKHLVTQMLTESLLLSGAGTTVGVLLATAGTSTLVRILASGRAFEQVDIEVHPDLHLLLFAISLAVLTGLLFGIAPAWYAFRSRPAFALRQRGGGGDTRSSRLLGKALVSMQIAFSITLLTVAFVFLSHLSRLRNFDLGFRKDHVLLVTLDPSRSGYRSEQLAERYRELLERLRVIPGVRSASISGCTPLEGCGSGSRYLKLEGHGASEDRSRAAVNFVSPEYFDTLGIPLISGSDFSDQDVGRSRVAVVNQAMARQFFRGENPIGKHVSVDPAPLTGGWFGDNKPYEIIGLVGDVKTAELRIAPGPNVYFNMFQEKRLLHELELRTSADPLSMSGTVRHAVNDALRSVPANRITTLSDQVDSNIVPERLMATLSEYFGGVGAALAGIGLYGLLAYTVARRTDEIGIRIALGATTANVSRLVLMDSLGMVGVGLSVGAVLVLWSGSLVVKLIEDLRWGGAIAFMLAAGATVVFVALASYVPVRRATRVDPNVALRRE